MTGAPLDILLVEDSPGDAELIQRTLARGGIVFTSRRVETESDMRAALATACPDVILADYHLPTFDGMAALAIAREIAREVPFIFVSGSLGEERAVEALRRGATDYVSKDRPSRLPSAVERAIRERDDERARAAIEAALVESERRLRLALEATQDAIWDLDLVSGSVHVSGALRDRWGIDRAPANLLEWLDCIHPDDRARVQQSVDRWLASREERCVFEYRIRRGDGTYGIALDRALVVRGADGEPLRLVGAIQDVTESRRLQEQLERTARVDSLGRMAATVAHEFNNVLMSVQPHAEILRRRAGSDARLTSIADSIIAAVRRGRLIINEIQTMSRVALPETEVFDLGAWLESIRTDLAGIAGANVRVTVTTSRAPVWVRCDRGQMQQVVTNLTANARDAVAAGGHVDLAVRRVDGMAELLVSDDGHGMPADIAAHIFEPLFTTKRNGTGLGLAVSHRVIAQNGGTISVDTAPGRGATFRVVLPLHGAAAEETAADVRESRAGDRAGHDGASLRVLIVEDNVSVAEGLQVLLEAEGMKCSVVHLGGEAEKAAETFDPDVVLLDVLLPDMDGKLVFDRLHQRWPELPVVFASGHIMDASALGDRADGANVTFLRKPFAVEELLEAFGRVRSPASA